MIGLGGLVTIKQAAKLLGVSVDTLRNWHCDQTRRSQSTAPRSATIACSRSLMWRRCSGRSCIRSRNRRQVASGEQPVRPGRGPRHPVADAVGLKLE